MRTASVLLIMMAAVAAPAAQDHPDFSGRWILESASAAGSDVPRAMSVHQLLVLRDVRGEPMAPFFKQITVDREFESSRRSDTHDIGVVGGVVPGRGADGSPTGPHRSHAVTWEGDALVFDNGSYTGPAPETGVWAGRREVWSLNENGRLQVVITTRSSMDLPTATELTYWRP